MRELGLAMIGLGLVPWFWAMRANRGTSLAHAVAWGLAAWLSWGGIIWVDGSRDAILVGLSLVGCAGVAVLGARRPSVAAWDFVVLGLLAVMLLTLAEKWLLG